MKFRYITKFTFLFVTLFASLIAAEELVIPYTVENSCPFEGCSYGNWEVLKETPVYKEADVNSEILGTLLVGTKANIETGVSYIIPGKAKIIGEPYKAAKKLDRNEFIFILNYLGEGYSRIYQNGEIVEAKVARTKGQCGENPNWRYCWVDILEEPIDQWWVKVKDSGWVPMEDNPLKPTDVLSQLMPHNKHMQSDLANARPLM
jgi:hypothetical protein